MVGRSNGVPWTFECLVSYVTLIEFRSNLPSNCGESFIDQILKTLDHCILLISLQQKKYVVWGGGHFQHEATMQYARKY